MMSDTRKVSDYTRRLVEMDKAHVWHPFTPMKQWMEGSPVVIERGEGFCLIDSEGNRYIDGFSSLWCNLHGHRVAKIDSAIRAQLDKIAHSTLLGYASGPSIELAHRLVQVAPPGLVKVFYSDSGATAVEVALKMAFQYYQNLGQPTRRKFLALRQSYHGDTIGSVSVGGIEAFHAVFRPLLFETTFVNSPNPFYHSAGQEASAAVLAEIDQALSCGAGQYCGVVVEPLIQAAAGMLTHPAGFLRDLRALTRKHDVLLIVDEVATGFGRTGRLFACEHEAVSPDLMCLGKGFSGGYLPVAATLTTQAIFDAFCGEPRIGLMFDHGHTFTGNALGCAAAVASFDLIQETRLLEQLPDKVTRMRRHLADLAGHPHVGDIRQCGLMAGIDLVADRDRRLKFDPEVAAASGVCRLAVSRGVMIRPLGDVVALMPAPGMDLATFETMMTTVVASLHDYFKKSPV